MLSLLQLILKRHLRTFSKKAATFVGIAVAVGVDLETSKIYKPPRYILAMDVLPCGNFRSRDCFDRYRKLT